jgi:hypothetical protein
MDETFRFSGWVTRFMPKRPSETHQLIRVNESHRPFRSPTLRPRPHPHPPSLLPQLLPSPAVSSIVTANRTSSKSRRPFQLSAESFSPKPQTVLTSSSSLMSTASSTNLKTVHLQPEHFVVRLLEYYFRHVLNHPDPLGLAPARSVLPLTAMSAQVRRLRSGCSGA